jgi:hypothetical protein
MEIDILDIEIYMDKHSTHIEIVDSEINPTGAD